MKSSEKSVELRRDRKSDSRGDKCIVNECGGG